MNFTQRHQQNKPLLIVNVWVERPAAVRAVANANGANGANGANRVAMVIPCYQSYWQRWRYGGLWGRYCA